jgi:predicted nucleotidyltransferase
MAQEPSENYMEGRPPKNIFPIKKQMLILGQIKKFIRENLPPNTKFYRKRLFGSLAKGTFGKYNEKFKGRKYSDVDILFVVDDNFKPPKKWKVHFECVKKVWVVYDVAEVPIETEDETVPVEVQYIILTKTFANKLETIVSAEKWGIPLGRSSTKNKFKPL